MKFPLLPLALAALAASALLPSSARAEASSVQIMVQQKSKSDIDDKDKSKRTQTRSLSITISNNGLAEVTLKVKHTIFGHPMDGKTIESVGSGEASVTVKPHAKAVVETKSETTSPSEKHRDKKGKEVPASGVKMIGYGVRVYEGENLVAEAYDPLSVKETMSK